VLAPNECIKNYIGKRNEQKVFVATQDEQLRNDLRNNGSVPIFFFRHNVLIMDSPSEVTEQKFKIKEQLKLEPTKAEKKFLQGQKKEIEQLLKEERVQEHLKEKEKIKDLYCMGISHRVAKGPNPMSVKRRAPKVIAKSPKKKKRRLRKGKRSRALSAAKKALV